VANEYVALYQEVFKQCNESLRDSDKKRDQLLIVYGALIGLFFNALDKSPMFRDVASLAVGIVGVALTVVLLNYRAWHLRYVNVAKCVLSMWSAGLRPTESSVRGAWEIHDRLGNGWNNPLRSTEAAIFNTFLVLSYLPWQFLIKSVHLIELPVASDTVPFVLNLIGYVVIWNCISLWFIRRRFVDSEGVWLLTFSGGSRNDVAT